jgi:hypothetical protein
VNAQKVENGEPQALMRRTTHQGPPTNVGSGGGGGSSSTITHSGTRLARRSRHATPCVAPDTHYRANPGRRSCHRRPRRTAHAPPLTVPAPALPDDG